MSVVVNSTLNDSLRDYWQQTPLSYLVVAGAAVLLSLSTAFKFPFSGDSKIYYPPGLQIVHAWKFFTKRYDFLNDTFRQTHKKFFEFYVNQYRVVAIRGENQRKIFYTEKTLSMFQGHQFLVGAAPSLKDINVMEDRSEDFHAAFFKRLLVVQHKDRVTTMIPALFGHIDRHFKALGREGSFDPFKETHDIIFEMTARLAACRELAEDKQAIRKLIDIYLDLEHGVTAGSILFPWFPSPSRKAKANATAALYGFLNSYVELRRKDPVTSTDTIDVFIAEGCNNPTIVAVIMNIVFAGVINTGVNVSWALVHLGFNPEWKEKVIVELKSLFAEHAISHATDPLHIQLSSIPLNAWETKTPVLEGVIRETLRLTMTDAPSRRIMSDELVLDGVVVKKGQFITYSQAEVHLNPAIYPKPYTFDPDRYRRGREEDKKEAFCYLAWGAGRHPCAGIKLAKLEMKMVLAMLLLGYDYHVVDENGNYPASAPRVDRNDCHQPRPITQDRVYIEFKRVVE
ncbi:hypothetical protein HYPSUDRAFT_601084 [Hypholoma sublateritium FD-334 SS-4]|uniref:Cytochrome P450 n=1 Tax=Hypholoma sublateritium (strain FD-334 SS-4) TaxID=945553 RepID=A0A0D2L7H9_HYPSF|nr:hypothetical protein HYPSUDRAFT_601084 [Hypholoma sublateritium FD-334 SS-4]